MRTASPLSGHQDEQATAERAPESRRRRGCDDDDCSRVASDVSVHGLAKVGEETGCTVRR